MASRVASLMSSTALGVWVWAQALGCIHREARERRSFIQLQFDIRGPS